MLADQVDAARRLNDIAGRVAEGVSEQGLGFLSDSSLHSGFTKMDVADGAQSFGSLLGGQIALSFGQHLITNHKLADRRGGAAAADKKWA